MGFRNLQSRTNCLAFTQSGNIIKTAGPVFYRHGIRFDPRRQLAREAKFLGLLSGNHFPRLIRFESNQLEMNNCGNPLEVSTIPLDWHSQIREIAAMLEEHRVIHRDIKPSNMLVKNGNLCLIDFGLAFQGVTDFWLSPRELSFSVSPIDLYSNLSAMRRMFKRLEAQAL